MQTEREQAARVKREREDGVATVVGGDDDDVEWVSTQPADRVAKGLRIGPREGDEVVALDD